MSEIETKCAVVQITDGLVINIIIARLSIEPPLGCELVEIMNEQSCNIGWYWDGFNFVPFAISMYDTES